MSTRPKQEYVLALESAVAVIGQDGIEALKAKRNSESRGLAPNKHEYSEEELAYENAVKFVDACDEMIAERQDLDALLIDPNNFDGFLDGDFKAGIKARFNTIFKKPVLKEEFQVFFKGLERVRRDLGLGDITLEQALEKAQLLEQSVGLRGVVSLEDADNANLLLVRDAIKDEVEALGFQPDRPPRWDNHEATQARETLRGQIASFVRGFEDSMRLAPIKPIEHHFEAVVADVLNGIPANALGSEAGRAILAAAVADDDALREVIEALIQRVEGRLRADAHTVFVPQGSEEPCGP